MKHKSFRFSKRIRCRAGIRLLFVLGAFLLHSSLFAQRSESNEVEALNRDTLFQQAEKLSYEGAHTKALKKYQQVLTKYKQQKDTVSTIIALNAIEKIYIKKDSISKAKEYQNRILELIGKTKKPKTLGLLYHKIGMGYYFIGNYRKTVEYLSKSLENYKAINDTIGIAINLINLGIAHKEKAEYSIALENYLEGTTLFEKLKDSSSLISCYSAIGNLYRQIKEPERSLDYHFKAMKLAKKLPNKNYLVITLNNIGLAYKENNMPDSALIYYRQTLVIGQQEENKKIMSKALANMGRAYFIKKDYEKAEQNYAQTLALKEELNDKKGMAIASNNSADIYITTKKYQLALPLLQRALELAKKTGAKGTTLESYKLYKKLYAAQGKYKQAFEYGDLYLRLKDTIFSEQKEKNQTEMYIRYDSEQKDERIKLLDYKQKITEQKSEKRQATIVKLINLVLVISFLLMTGILFYNWKLQKQKRKHAQAIIKEQKRGLAAVISTQETERQRISRDLHDGIGQQLSSVRLSLQNIAGIMKKEENKNYEDIQRVNQMLQGTAKEVRGISHQMRPAALSKSGLFNSLEELLYNSFRDLPIQLDWVHFQLEKKRFGENIEIGLYRIIQELLNNIIKHAEARKVWVQLLNQSEKLVFIVEDDGKGFNPDRLITEGIGLLNIKSRVDALNGFFHCESTPGKGTITTIRIPTHEQN